MCTCDTERLGTSQERDHPVQKGAWGLWKFTALSVCWHSSPFLCRLSPQHELSQGHRDRPVLVFPFNTCNLKAGRRLSTHQIHKREITLEAQPLSSLTSSAIRLSLPVAGCPRSKSSLFPGCIFFRKGLQHQVHVLLITWLPAIMGLLLGRVRLVQRK